MLHRLYYSFPVQLLLVHLKKQHILLLFWVMLFGMVTKVIFRKLGIPFLFLDPEYLGKVGFRSFFLLGVAFGGFLMAWNVACYILHSFRFPFLATLKRPFEKFCINNFIVPLVFLLVFVYCIYDFQIHSEFQSVRKISLELLGFFCGMFAIVFLSFIYFFNTNKDIFKIPGINWQRLERRSKRMVFKKSSDSSQFIKAKSNWRVDVYLSHPFKVRLVRSVEHYDPSLLSSVFRQNHINALLIEIFAFAILVVLGLLIDYPIFRIPAGASILLLFSILMMITGAFSFWLRGWRTTAFVAAVILLNFMFGMNLLNTANKAIGLNYAKKPPIYNLEQLKRLSNDEKILHDKENAFYILKNWRDKTQKYMRGKRKPKIIFINASGGGLRSAVWTLKVLQEADSILKGKFFDQTFMLCGASGGVVGAAYYRELFLRKKTTDTLLNLHHKKYIDNISKDVLNPVSYQLAVTDIFFPWQKIKIGEYNYPKDRGYAFEQQFNENTEFVLDKTLSDYSMPELKAVVPLLILSPTIINDGRRLYISSQPVSFLTKPRGSYLLYAEQEVDAVDFTSLFAGQEPFNLKFTSALRMNSTVPYITPAVMLPTNPPIEVMDAGMRDNFGVETSVRFLHVFRNWINENTSGIIFISIRDTEKEAEVEISNKQTIIDKLLNPIGNFYNNWSEFQDYYHDNLIEYAAAWTDGRMDVLRFEYVPKDKNKNASLSWHLTTSEKKDILQAIKLPHNQKSLGRLKKLLE